MTLLDLGVALRIQVISWAIKMGFYSPSL